MRNIALIAIAAFALGACEQVRYTTERGGELAGRGVDEYCDAPEEVRMLLREDFNRGLNRTAPGSSIHINCPPVEETE